MSEECENRRTESWWLVGVSFTHCDYICENSRCGAMNPSEHNTTFVKYLVIIFVCDAEWHGFEGEMRILKGVERAGEVEVGIIIRRNSRN